MTVRATIACWTILGRSISTTIFCGFGALAAFAGFGQLDGFRQHVWHLDCGQHLDCKQHFGRKQTGNFGVKQLLTRGAQLLMRGTQLPKSPDWAGVAAKLKQIADSMKQTIKRHMRQVLLQW